MDRDELLIRDYEITAQHVLHFDKQFYETSRFFLLIEAALFAAFVDRLSNELIAGEHIPTEMLLFVIVIIFSNLSLCYIWFRTNRTYREFLEISYKRAMEIESKSALGGIPGLYITQQDMMKEKGYKSHSSNWWEIRVPIVFMIAWILSLILVAFGLHNLFWEHVILSLIILFICLLEYIEETGWPTQEWPSR